MPEFRFNPPESLPPDALLKKSTTAKIAFEPPGAFVDASIYPIQNEDNDLPFSHIAYAASQPRAEGHDIDRPVTVKLYLTQGEFGKILAVIDLGTL